MHQEQTLASRWRAGNDATHRSVVAPITKPWRERRIGTQVSGDGIVTAESFRPRGSSLLLPPRTC